jgi:hypothetical protein
VRIVRERVDRGTNRSKMGALPSPRLLVIYWSIRRVTDHLSEVVEVPPSIYVLQKKGSVGFRYAVQSLNNALRHQDPGINGFALLNPVGFDHGLAKNDTFVVVQLPEGEAATYENADAETQFGKRRSGCELHPDT